MANYVYLENNGIITPDTSDIKAEVQAEFQTALGTDLSLEDGTPQGRLIDMETEARTQVAINNAYVSNMWNFNKASGLVLDAWGANFNLERDGAESSRVTATVTGLANTVIAQGSRAATNDGYMFYAENNIIIGSNRSATGTFLSVEKGEIPCSSNSLTKIIDGTLGWETITNTAPAILGHTKQADASFKKEFYNSGLFSGYSLWQDYKNELNKVENVVSSYVVDNGEATAVTVDTVTINAHSIYVCVDGGSDEEVAMALLKRKAVGCGWTGNTTVNVIEPVYNRIHTVSFQRPTFVNIYSSISIDTSNVSDSNPQSTVQNAIYNYINNLAIGTDVLPFQLAAVIYEALPGVKITSLGLGTTQGTYSTNTITIHINQAAKVQQLSDITVTIV